MLTIHEQERFAFCVGSPGYSDLAQACDIDDKVAALEAQFEDLEDEVKDLEQWRDGDKERELDKATAEVESLRTKNERATHQLRSVMSALTGKECSNSAGRQLLAKTLQNFLIKNR